jgi:hypothetical protein
VDARLKPNYAAALAIEPILIPVMAPDKNIRAMRLRLA